MMKMAAFHPPLDFFLWVKGILLPSRPLSIIFGVTKLALYMKGKGFGLLKCLGTLWHFGSFYIVDRNILSMGICDRNILSMGIWVLCRASTEQIYFFYVTRKFQSMH